MEVFISENVYNNEKFPLTSAGKHRYRETEEGQNVMCEIVEKIKLEAKQEGRTEERYSAITKLLNNNFDEETIIALGYTLDEIKAAEKDKQKES